MSERGGMRRDEARQLLEDAVTRWRGDAARFGERAGESLAGGRAPARPRHPRGDGRARAPRRATRAPAAPARASAGSPAAARFVGTVATRDPGQRDPTRSRCNTERMAQPAQRSLGRMSEIAQVAVRHGFGYWLETHKLTDLLPWPRPQATLEAEASPTQRGRHLREMLDELGPTFVKFGQLLSTRPDIVPPDIIAELRALQDDVTPFAFSEVERVVREELELPIEKLFTSFEETPMAAASIGQVHRAVLPNGKRVAVKVQRPDAPRQIEADLSAPLPGGEDRQGARPLARLHRRPRAGRRVLPLDPARARLPAGSEERPDVPPELRRPSHTSASLTSTGATPASACSRSSCWKASRWPTSSSRRSRWTSGAHIAYLITEAWMTMIFRHGFFHADPHPANILADQRRADRPRRLRAGREAVRRRHVEADGAVHRRCGGERRRARRGGSAIWACATTALASRS